MAQLTTQIVIAGNLTRDPEVRFTQSGQAVASFSVASTPRSYDKDTKQYVDGDAIFTNCTLWGKPAENLGASLAKGSRVLVVGQLKSRTYEAKDGTMKTAVELIVDDMGASLLFATVDVHRGGGGSGRPSAPSSGQGATASVPDEDIPW